MIVALTGFMGSGKSSTGRVLSEKLGLPFTDLDGAIEERAGKTIPEIFATEGEKAFRALETSTLKDIVEKAEDNLVLSLGGGTVMEPQARTILAEHCFCIYLKASVETLVENLAGAVEGRPMLSGASLRERIAGLLEERSATYEATADATVDVDGLSPEQAAEAIVTICRQ